MKLIIFIAVAFEFLNLAGAETAATPPEWTTRLIAEMGTVGVQNHRIQFGKNGTYFDYLRDGEQDILFPFQRFEAHFVDRASRRIVFLYQPLEFNTQAILDDDIIVDGETFAKDTAIDLRYSFPFYRASYLWMSQLGTADFSWGASLQIRNASVGFTSANGEKRRVNQNIGPVPALKFMYQDKFLSTCSWAAELDTIYAPVKYLNGSDSDFVGAFTDFSLKLKTPLKWDGAEVFTALRYVGGGATGTSSNPKGRGDGFNANCIDLLAFSLGLSAAI